MTSQSGLSGLRAAADPFWTYFERYEDQPLPDGAADLRFGNPTELAPPAYVAALHRWTDPQSPDWFAYPVSLPSAREHVAALCATELALEVDADDVHLTNGTFGALAVVLHALLDPGDEVVVLDPPWFFYDLQVAAAGGRTVHVPLDPPSFSPDASKVHDAITDRTRAVVVNSPNNPTGRIYTGEELAALAGVLQRASRGRDRPIVLLSDDSYRRIVFDGRSVPHPAAHYPDTILMHTYGKTTLAPGERIGWLAVPAACREREALREAVPLLQVALGWAWPDAVLQRALADLEQIRIDLSAMQERRDHLVGALTSAGYQVTPPEGTFYVLVRCPVVDDVAFCDALARDHDTYVLPGAVFRAPGWFRMSLTASDEMVRRAAAALTAIAAAG